MTPMRELTVKELDQVSGGAALNFFFRLFWRSGEEADGKHCARE